MPNKTQLSPEGAMIAQAVARSNGLASNVLAPNMRLHSGGKPAEKAVEVPDLSRPAMELVQGDPASYNLVCNSPLGLILGMKILHRDGMDVMWSIVARRAGAKIWQLDYDSERVCEIEKNSIRIWLDTLMTEPQYTVFHDTLAKKLTLFNPVTGQEL